MDTTEFTLEAQTWCVNKTNLAVDELYEGRSPSKEARNLAFLMIYDSLVIHKAWTGQLRLAHA